MRKPGGIMFNLISFIIMVSILACEKNETFPKLSLSKSVDLYIIEPSGLCLAKEGKSLYVASDDDNRIVEINLDGEYIKQIVIGKADYEGITVDPATGSIWLADEQNRRLVNIDTMGDFIMNVQVPGSNNINSGMEGISYNPSKKEFYVLIEKDPGKLLIVDSLFNITNTFQLSFAEDYSGCFYDADDNALWIVSEQSKVLAKCNLEGIPTQRYTFDEDEIEGIVYTNESVYLVSDSQNKLFIYDFEY